MIWQKNTNFQLFQHTIFCWPKHWDVHGRLRSFEVPRLWTTFCPNLIKFALFCNFLVIAVTWWFDDLLIFGMLLFGGKLNYRGWATVQNVTFLMFSGTAVTWWFDGLVRFRLLLLGEQLYRPNWVNLRDSTFSKRCNLVVPQGPYCLVVFEMPKIVGFVGYHDFGDFQDSPC